MRSLEEHQLDSLLSDATTIEADGHGVKVACLADGDYLKLFRRKRLLSSALWSPQASRFASNAAKLARMGIPVPQIIDTFKVPSRALNGVIYRPLPGQTLRSHWRDLGNVEREADICRFGAFLGLLHEQGVYFRSLHLGNVLLLPDNRFGLIDFSDMRIARRPLGKNLRRRNLQHLLRYDVDRNWLALEHRPALLRGYATRCGSEAATRLNMGIQALVDSHQA